MMAPCGCRGECFHRRYPDLEPQRECRMFGYPVRTERRPMPIPGDLVIMVWGAEVAPPPGWTISRDKRFVWRIWTGSEIGPPDGWSPEAWVALRPTSSWREVLDEGS